MSAPSVFDEKSQVKIETPAYKMYRARRFDHLSVRQRNAIFKEFEKLIAECAPAWPGITDFYRVRTEQAEKYGVDGWIILRVYNHLRVKRGLSR